MLTSFVTNMDTADTLPAVPSSNISPNGSKDALIDSFEIIIANDSLEHTRKLESICIEAARCVPKFSSKEMAEKCVADFIVNHGYGEDDVKMIPIMLDNALGILPVDDNYSLMEAVTANMTTDSVSENSCPTNEQAPFSPVFDLFLKECGTHTCSEAMCVSDGATLFETEMLQIEDHLSSDQIDASNALAEIDKEINAALIPDAPEQEHYENVMKLLNLANHQEKSATRSFNLAKYNYGRILTRLKKITKHGEYKRISSSILEGWGTCPESRRKARKYSSIPNLYKYLNYPFEIVLTVYTLAKSIFSDSNDPISDFIDTVGLGSLGMLDTSRKTLSITAKAVELQHLSVVKGKPLSYSEASNLIKEIPDERNPEKLLERLLNYVNAHQGSNIHQATEALRLEWKAVQSQLAQSAESFEESSTNIPNDTLKPATDITQYNLHDMIMEADLSCLLESLKQRMRREINAAVLFNAGVVNSVNELLEMLKKYAEMYIAQGNKAA